MFVVLLGLTLILTILVFLPLWRHEAWWVRALDFPRLQLIILSLAFLCVLLCLCDLSHPPSWGVIFLTTLCVIYQTWWILPYTRLFPVEVKPSNTTDSQRTIRILTANVLTPNRNAETLIALIRQNKPDVLVTLESDMWWQNKLDTLEPEYPHTVKCPLDNLYGMHVYSKMPLKNAQIEYLVEPDKPSIHTLVSLPSGDDIRLHFLHPAPPFITENPESSERDAELIIVGKSVAKTHQPVIVAGDLNDVSWSATTRLFRKISGLLDPRIGRGIFNTFHAKYWFLRYPLDHLFHSHHFTLSSIYRLPKFGSDHFALLTELVLHPQNNNPQNGLEADPEDLSWAKSKIEDQNVDQNDVPNP